MGEGSYDDAMSSPSSVEDLIALRDSGAALKFLFFWGHRPRQDGSAGPGCLSQWWPSPFTVDGRVFATAEHWMMWSKAMLFGDEATAARVLAAEHPGEAKNLGREVRRFDENVWQRERFGIVVAGSIAKFEQHQDLQSFLLGTGKRILVEASPLDRVWGIGLAATDPKASDPVRWEGLNLLGFALMRAREVVAAPA